MFTVIQEHSEEQDLVILAHCHNYAFLEKQSVRSLECDI